jgi:hypothetical protein
VAYPEEQQKQLVAPPRLYGAPAYARPPAPVAETPRPFDPDDLPIAATLTDEEREWIDSLPARAYAPGGGVVIATVEADQAPGEVELRPRPFLLRALTDRIRRSE